MNKKRILIVDDDSDITMITGDMLSEYGYEIEYACDTMTAYEKLADCKCDLILLDVNMPGENGLEFCKRFRKISKVPIIFISARNSEFDRIAGLDIGGDDYMGKPFSLMELLSRVNSLMRRTYGLEDEKETFCIGDIELNKETRVVKKRGEKIKLSLKEFDVLLYLIKNKNKTVKKDVILSEIWGMFSTCEVSTLSVHIRWLREKLEDDPAKPAYIKTVWGIGYCLTDGEEE